MFCAFHKERLAHSKCSACDSDVCSDCSHIQNGTVYCPSCLPEAEVVTGKDSQHNPGLALLLSIFPGLGQVYNNQLGKGLLIFFTSWLIIPWAYGMYDAYMTARRMSQQEMESNISSGLFAGCLVLIILMAGTLFGGPLFFVNAVPSFVHNFVMRSTEADIKNALEDISGAVKAYQKDHGAYPTDVADLYFGAMPYLSDMHCDTVKGPYRYTCQFNHDGYVVLIVPLEEGLPGYRMTPGPVVEKLK